MKIIHTADLHLGSSFGSSLPGAKVAERRRELVYTFDRMADFAVKNGVELFLLAGDVFDDNLPPRNDKEFFYDVIKRHPEVVFLYLKGNHDSLPSYTEKIPNLLTFGPEWTSYRFGNLCVYGMELPEKGGRRAAETLRCDPDNINIVMLHGQTGSSEDDIVIRDYAGRGIDYMALGHIHSFSYGDIDVRGKYAYSGCPEGRGFDETGEKGFVLLETGAGLRFEFIPFALRTVRLLEIDVSGFDNKQDALAEGLAKANEIPEKDMVRLVFKGNAVFNTAGLAGETATRLSQRFFHVSVKDCTSSMPDTGELAKEESLIGEFVRLAAEAEVPEGLDRGRIMTIGIKALRGELGDYKKER